MSNVQPFEVSETQLQVGTNLNSLILQLRVVFNVLNGKKKTLNYDRSFDLFSAGNEK